MADGLGFIATLASFCLAMLVGHIIFKHKSFKFLLTRKGRHASLDGMRGFLAISVFFHHFIITWYWKIDGKWVRPPEDYFQNYGKVGVALFFMITGFLFVSKIIQTEGKVNWFNLYESRLFRIFPLYVFVLTVISFVVFSSSNYELNVSASSLVKQYFNWVIFHGGSINDFTNTRKVIAGVDWTLKYEWFFYMSLPILSFIFMKFGKLGGASLFIVCVFLFFNPINILSINAKLLIFFAFGGFAAYLTRLIKIPRSIIEGNVVSGVVGLALIFSLFYPSTFDAIHVVIIFIVFILVVLGNDLFGVFSLKSSILLGEISYSIYLLHGVVLYLSFTYLSIVEVRDYALQEYLMFMPVISVVVIVLSSLTFVFIERPSITLGRKYYLSSMLSRVRVNANKSN